MSKKFFALFLVLFSLSFVSSASVISTGSTCCEKTTEGGWCVNTDAENCDDSFKSSATSCESTSYCKLGTCYDSSEGICMENTPQRVCQDEGGTWDAREIELVPQCQLGCCILSDQAAFVTLTRCKALSSYFGVAINYDSEIGSEVQCIAEAQSQDMGACVYEQDFEVLCDFTTRADCGASLEVETINETNQSITQKTFYKDVLCSAEELGTSCARQAETKCAEGDVYWFDSCGNKENVYAGGSSEEKDKSWNNGRVKDADEICSPDSDDKSCGNCDYLLGTRCAEWEGFLGVGKPSGSDYFCRRNVCVDRYGNERKNGESWCVVDSQPNAPGARYYREVCIDGSVEVEPCADFRNEICVSSFTSTEEGNFETANCRVNRWQDCSLITTQEACVNKDARDCKWLPPVKGLLLGASEDSDKVFSNPTKGDSFSNPSSSITGNAIFGDDEEETPQENTTTNREFGVCVPEYSPGFDFWQSEEASRICSQASAKCVVKFEKGLLQGEEECIENCECLEQSWGEQMNNVCSALGDCGGSVNYRGTKSDSGYTWVVDGIPNKLSTGATTTGTGNVIGIDMVKRLFGGGDD